MIKLFVKAEYSDRFLRFTVGDLDTNDVIADKFFIYTANEDVASFLGISYAIGLLLRKKQEKGRIVHHIKTGVEWVKARKCNFKSNEEGLQGLIARAEKLLDENPLHPYEIEFGSL